MNLWIEERCVHCHSRGCLVHDQRQQPQSRTSTMLAVSAFLVGASLEEDTHCNDNRGSDLDTTCAVNVLPGLHTKWAEMLTCSAMC